MDEMEQTKRIETFVLKINSEQSETFDWRFWAIFLPLCTASLLVALEGTVISTALPSIDQELKAGDISIWFANGYFVAFTAFQPIYAQMSQFLGRRWPMILSVIIFALGSGISGGANGPIMLLAGRIVQGTGGAGIGLLTHIIISDLVPVRERSKFMAIIFSSFAVGTALGPFIGGTVVQRVSWRWVFYINLPISGVAVLLLYLFLQVQSIKPQSSRGILIRVDFIGIFLLMTSVTALLLGVSFGGSRFPWSSWRVIVPLALGSLGLFLFYAYEASGLCLEPILPFRILVSNRTTTIGLILSFCHFLFSYWMIYILPVYFQGVLLLSPEKSGMLLLPTVLVIVPLSVISGVILTRSGRYKPMHIIATGLITLGSGFFILLDSESSVFECVVCQCIMASGVGMLMSTLVPAVQAGLPEADVSVATATWGFFRASGGIWGVAIPGAILDSQFQRYLRNRIHNLDVVRTLEKGSAYSHILDIYFRDISPDLHEDLIGIYVDSLRVVWAVCTVISGLSFLLCLLEKEIPLRIKIDSRYGLNKKQNS